MVVRACSRAPRAEATDASGAAGVGGVNVGGSPATARAMTMPRAPIPSDARILGPLALRYAVALSHTLWSCGVRGWLFCAFP